MIKKQQKCCYLLEKWVPAILYVISQHAIRLYIYTAGQQTALLLEMGNHSETIDLHGIIHSFFIRITGYTLFHRHLKILNISLQLVEMSFITISSNRNISLKTIRTILINVSLVPVKRVFLMIQLSDDCYLMAIWK